MTVAELDVKINGRIDLLEKELGKARVQIRAFAEQAKNDTRNATRDIASQADALGKKLTATLTLPIAAAAVAAGKAAMDFDQALRNVDSIAKLSTKGLAELHNEVLDMARDPSIRQGPQDLATGLYEVYSSGFKGKQALEVLRVSAIGASAGMSDTATSSKALMAVLNSGIPGVKSAKEAMDILFKEVDLGVNSFGDLASQIGDVLPTAAAAKVRLQEVTAAIATMTRGGISAAESVTSLNQMMLHIIKPSESAAKLMKAAGIEFGITALESKGLSGWLAEVEAKFGRNKQALTEIMPEVRGLRGLLSLTRNDGKDFNEMLNGMGKASAGAGSATEALRRQNAGLKAQFDIAIKDFKIAAIEIGETLAPEVRRLTADIRALGKWISSLSPEQRRMIVDAGLVVAALGPLVIGFGKVAAGIQAIIALRAGYQAAALSFQASSFAAATGIASITVAAALAAVAIATLAAQFKVYQELTRGQGEFEARNKSIIKNKSGYKLWDDAIRSAPGSSTKEKFDYFRNDPMFRGNQGKVHSRLGVSFEDYQEHWINKQILAGSQNLHNQRAAKAAQEAAKAQALGGGTFNLADFKGGGSKPKESDAMREARQHAEEYAETLSRLKLAKEAVGVTTDWQMAKLERAYGQYHDLSQNEWKTVYSIITATERKKNALDKTHEAQIKAKEIAKKAAEEAKQQAEDAKQQAEERNKAIKQELASRIENLDMMGFTTELEKAQYEVTKGGLKDANQFAKTYAVTIAYLTDRKKKSLEVDAAAAAAEKGATNRTWVNGLVDAVTEFQKKQHEAMRGDFAGYIAGINREMAQLRATTLEDTVALDVMSQSFSKNWVMAFAAFAKAMKLEKVRQFRSEMHDLSENSAKVLVDNFTSGFDAIGRGFSQMLADMARQYLQSQLANLLFNNLTKLFGGASLFPAKAVGGPVSGGRPYLVGERGPELFVPNGSGTVATAGQTAGMAGPMVVNVHINSYDRPIAGSEAQIGRKIAEQTQRQMRRNG